jgi:hypothetical protein
LNEHEPQDNGDPIDLAALDPSRDHAAWEARLSAIVAQAVSLRESRSSLSGRLVSWSPALFAGAAAVALLALGSLYLPERAPASRPAEISLMAWTIGGERPDPIDVLVTFGPI